MTAWQSEECSLKTEYRDQTILNILKEEVKTSEVTKLISLGYKQQAIVNEITLYTCHATLCMENRSTRRRPEVRLSEQERRVDALALRAEERRDKLR